MWTISLVALVSGQLAISVLIGRGTTLTIASDLLQSALLLLACAAFVPNIFGCERGSRARLFWILMSMGMFFWLAYQGLWIFFEVVLRKEVPVIFTGDIILFLHLVPMIAALALRPHLKESDPGAPVGMLDFTLLLTWWVFLYVYCVIPWQYVEASESAYSNNYNQVYLTEKLVLLLVLVYAGYTSRSGWRHFYGQLLAAIALYASSSYVANWAIGRGLYYTGSIYDIPLTISIAWLASLGKFSSRSLSNESDPSSQPLFSMWVTRMAMLAVFSLPWLALSSLLDGSVSAAVKTFRIGLSLGALVAMGAMVFWRQHLLGSELSRLLARSRTSYEDLQSLQEQLIHSEKLASLGRLVGGAAHEINNPLAAMLGYSELLSCSELPPEEKRIASRISGQVRRTRALVANLLSFASESPARWSPVDVNSLLQTALRLLQPQLEEQSVATEIELGSSLGLVTADSNQLLRVTLHLAGQVASTLSQEKSSTLRVYSSSKQDYVVVEFSCDHIASEQEPWLSLEEHSEKYPTLSLSACRRIVKDHGGRILFRHFNDAVTAFRMELPVTRADIQAPREHQVASFGASVGLH
jgi:signal transduction histidine kinase